MNITPIDLTDCQVKSRPLRLEGLVVLDDQLGQTQPRSRGQGSVSVGHEGLLLREVVPRQLHSRMLSRCRRRGRWSRCLRTATRFTSTARRQGAGVGSRPGGTTAVRSLASVSQHRRAPSDAGVLESAGRRWPAGGGCRANSIEGTVELSWPNVAIQATGSIPRRELVAPRCLRSAEQASGDRDVDVVFSDAARSSLRRLPARWRFVIEPFDEDVRAVVNQVCDLVTASKPSMPGQSRHDPSTAVPTSTVNVERLASGQLAIAGEVAGTPSATGNLMPLSIEETASGSITSEICRFARRWRCGKTGSSLLVHLRRAGAPTEAASGSARARSTGASTMSIRSQQALLLIFCGRRPMGGSSSSSSSSMTTR